MLADEEEGVMFSVFCYSSWMGIAAHVHWIATVFERSGRAAPLVRRRQPAVYANKCKACGNRARPGARPIAVHSQCNTRNRYAIDSVQQCGADAQPLAQCRLHAHEDRSTRLQLMLDLVTRLSPGLHGSLRLDSRSFGTQLEAYMAAVGRTQGEDAMSPEQRTTKDAREAASRMHVSASRIAFGYYKGNSTVSTVEIEPDMEARPQRRKREAPHAIVHSMALELQHTHTSDTTMPNQTCSMNNYVQLTADEFSVTATVSSEMIARANSRFVALTYIRERLTNYPLLTSGKCGSVTPQIASLLHESNAAQTSSSDIDCDRAGWEPLVLLLQTQPSAQNSDGETPVLRKIMENHALGFCDMVSNRVLIGAFWKRNQVPGTLQPTHGETSNTIQHLLSAKRPHIYALSLRRRKFGVLCFDNDDNENTTRTPMCEAKRLPHARRLVRRTRHVPAFGGLSLAIVATFSIQSPLANFSGTRVHNRRAGGTSNRCRSHQRPHNRRVGFYANLLEDVVGNMDMDLDNEPAQMMIDSTSHLNHFRGRLIEALSIKRKATEKQTGGAKFRKFIRARK
ncbi:uncharacterized protein EV422DRAFT_581996 [Fimicolochytrium jonesii]|uniref:uncharacterized protein n=1 Tax=Fimicolochytrium jonesii TaxID=1396493 RepID=UPI0022FE8EB4|nr:uncharacterized protein EV422DRAFT_581996 [Fimicolochytrium jonesii]KAI8815628.1 hypothetical protein EV422DRAFT_581996 [Fimicolochytrium jonesii]